MLMMSIDFLLWGVLPIVAILGVGAYFVWRSLGESSTAKDTVIQSGVESIGYFKKKNFTASKEISLGMPSITETLKFVVDDYQKKFGFYRFSSTGYNELELWNYSDLLDFNLVENGQQMIPGRGMMAAGGAILFGVKGAIVGSVAGDKAIKDICTEISVQIKINNLNKPLISIGLGGGFEKTSVAYQQAKQKADELVATLTYIESNKNAQPVDPPQKPQENLNKPVNLNMKDFLS